MLRGNVPPAGFPAAGGFVGMLQSSALHTRVLALLAASSRPVTELPAVVHVVWESPALGLTKSTAGIVLVSAPGW